MPLYLPAENEMGGGSGPYQLPDLQIPWNPKPAPKPKPKPKQNESSANAAERRTTAKPKPKTSKSLPGSLPVAKAHRGGYPGTPQPAAIPTGPIKWNPHPHPTTRHTYVPGKGADGTRVDERLGYIRAVRFDAEKQRQNGLGRKTDWRFRFLYNPTKVQIHTEVITNLDINQVATYSVGSLQPGMQAVSLELLLNRQADVTDSSRPHYAEFRRRGTNYDLDFFYRVLNGDPKNDPASGVVSSDFGYIISSVAVRLYLGRYFQFNGFVTGLDITHEKFTQDMVPIMTTISFTVNRFSNVGGPLSIDDPTKGWS